ncbi:MAG: PAAR domain-containing protein [Candidatus Zixiibacteriota bacterium]|nr:MAG: PAAR domain-containing protein [candidate division Zixibacteria bacterium]
MGKPAARMGDQTAHGGVITKGEPTVMIGGQPAARQTDMHTCPLVNPGTPPPPHVGGPILMGSPTVLIKGLMAARVGDSCQCSGPPDSIVMGCNTVLIGESSAGGAGAGQSGSGKAETGTSTGTDEKEEHFIDAKVVDKGGKPITGAQYKLKDPDNVETISTLAGRVKKSGVKEGQYELSISGIKNVKWEKTEAKAGDTVKMIAETVGFGSDAKATFQVFQKDFNRADAPRATVDGVEVSGDKAETEWTFEYTEGEDEPEIGHATTNRYSYPRFYFTVTIDQAKATSGLLKLTDDLEIELKDDEGNAKADEPYKVYLASGEVRSGTLDKDGKATEKGVPPTRNQVVFPNQAKAKRLPR